MPMIHCIICHLGKSECCRQSPFFLVLRLCSRRELQLVSHCTSLRSWERIMTRINNAVWEMAQNKILQKGTNITQVETSALIKYGCLSSLPHTDRWRGSADFGFCCIFFVLELLWQLGNRAGHASSPSFAALGCPLKAQTGHTGREVPHHTNKIHS